MSTLHIPTFAEVLAVSRSHGRTSKYPHLWNGLVGLWGGWQGGGLTLFDVSGRGNNGTLINMDPATDWVMTEKGWALKFSDTAPYVGCGTFIYRPTFTFVARIKRTSGIGSNFRGVAAHHPAGMQDDGDWYLYFGADNKLHVDIPWVRSNVYVGSQAITDSDWHMVALVRTGTAGAWVYTVWIDGLLDDSNGTAYNPNTGTHEFTLAILHETALGSHVFNGNFASAALYDRALAPSEFQKFASDEHAIVRPMQQIPVGTAAVAGGLSIPIAAHHYKLLAG